MGLEIDHFNFTEEDFKSFRAALASETALLKELTTTGQCSEAPPIAGFEIEAWLIDQNGAPAPRNAEFLEKLDDPLACPELAKFNIELNNHPRQLGGDALRQLQSEIEKSWAKASNTAEEMQLQLAAIGILPTLKKSALCLKNMSELNRYRALNEQILSQRHEPIHLDIYGKQHLKCDHNDVMLESATTSFQLHMQVPLCSAHHFYNASIIASAACVAISANSPYLFQHDLWDETRIPLFEQSIETGGIGGAAHGPLRRVSFGSGFSRRSIFEVFEENLNHFPVLLPIKRACDRNELFHLRLHNGTIWRWNRPLIGFDTDGTPHIRIEQRTMAAGPTIIDSIANAAFFYGLATSIAEKLKENEELIPFAMAKDNFYRAARHGLSAHLQWSNDEHGSAHNLIENRLIPMAKKGLSILGIDLSETDYYLEIIRQRVLSRQNGCHWQRAFIEKNGLNFEKMLDTYLTHQKTGQPVHTWPL